MPSYGSSRVKGITIEIGGDTTKLDKALGSVNHELTTMQKDLSAVERRLKLDPTNTELLAQKQRLLAETITKTADRMKILESGSDGLKRSLDEGKISAEDYEKKSKALGLELAVTESDMKSAERALADLNDEMKKAGSPADDMADALKDVGDAAEDATDGMGGLDGASGGLSGSLGGLKGVALGAAVAIGEKLVEAAIDAVKQLWEMDEATEDYRVAMGKLNTAFETAGYSSETATEAYRGFYAILGDTDTAAEASQLLVRLANNEEEMARWVDIAAGVYGTFGDSIPIEGLIEAANETAKVGKVTGVLADALNWVGISEEDFNKALEQNEDSAYRANLIMKTLANTYEDASASFYRNNEAIIANRNAQSELDESLALIGEAVSNVKTALLELFGPALSALAQGAAGAFNGIADLIHGVSDALGWLGDRIEDIINFFLDLPRVVGVAFQVISELIDNIGDGLSWLTDRIQNVIALFKDLFGLDSGSYAPSDKRGGGRNFRIFPNPYPANPYDPYALYALPTAFAEDLPHLARGGVIQPNNPFLAVVGDNTQEREIIAPESTLEQTVQRAMAHSGAGSSAQRITIPITLELDGSILARKMYTYNAGEAARRGPQLVN